MVRVLADPGADYVIRCTLQSIESTNYWTMVFGLEDFDFWTGSHTWRGKKNGEIYKYWTIVVNIYYC